MSNLSKQLSLANARYYEDGTEVEAYLKRKYHRLRLEIAGREIKQHQEHLQYREAVMYLDMGCSSGLGTEVLYADAVQGQMYGLDASQVALSEAASRNILGIEADAQEPLPFPDNHFDVVTICELIEHLIDVHSVFLEIRRVLKPDGLLVLTTPNLARFVDRLRFVFGSTPKQTIPGHPYLRYHVTPFTASSLKKCLQECGYAIIHLSSNYVYLDPIFGTKLKSRILARVFPSLGGTLIVSAVPCKGGSGAA